MLVVDRSEGEEGEEANINAHSRFIDLVFDKFSKASHKMIAAAPQQQQWEQRRQEKI